jgi:hypothetical protein
MDSTDRVVDQALVAFERSRDAIELTRAVEAMEAAEARAGTANTPGAGAGVARTLRFFAALDRAIDIAWDVARQPPHGVAPPPSHRGMVRGSGEVDPADIADPAERARYVEALKAAKDAEREYDLQFQMRRLDERVTQLVGRQLAERSRLGVLDRAGFDSLLAAAPLSEERRRRLQALAAGLH